MIRASVSFVLVNIGDSCVGDGAAVDGTGR
jgi:hypothetical protein